MRTRENLAWAAGFFEGEGHFGPKGASMTQVNLEPLLRFRAVIGFGNVYGPWIRPAVIGMKNAQKKPSYQWQISNFEYYQATIAMLWHWLSPLRQDQARQRLVNWSGKVRPGNGPRRAYKTWRGGPLRRKMQ